MTETLYLLATIAGERVAFDAAAVDSVVEAEAVTPVPRVATHVAGLSALRSRVLTIIDCLAALGLPARPDERAGELIVVTVDGHLYGLAVDRVDDAVPLAPPSPVAGAALAPGWARAARGLVEHDGQVLLVIDPAALVAGPAAAIAA